MSSIQTKTKDVVILWFGTEFNHNYKWKYRETMERLGKHGLENGIRFIHSSVYQYNNKKTYFETGWLFDWEKWVPVKKIKPSKVLYKSNKINHLSNCIQEEFEFYNDLKLVLLANNKFDTARYFKKYSPKTLRLSDIEKSSFNINSLKKEEYVIKPINWSGGAGIMKVKKDELKDTLSKFWYGKENVIIQDFLDMSCGLEWVVEGMHDLRVSIFGKKVFPHVYIRKPKDGDFKSNISAWWTDYFISMKKFPKEFKSMVRCIVKKINEDMWEGIYSIDIVNTTEWFKLMELNSSPGFLFKEKDIQKEYFDYIINTLQ